MFGKVGSGYPPVTARSDSSPAVSDPSPAVSVPVRLRPDRRAPVRLALAVLGIGAGLGLGAPAAAALSIAAPAVTATEGAAFAGPVASFTDLAAVGCPNPSTYSATVTWADEGISAATVGPASGGVLTCAYSVSAAHTFGEEGSHPVTVTVTGAGGPPTTATGTARVADAPLTATGAGLTAVAGTPLGATVARLSDADPGDPASAYTVTVAWGDGTTTTDPAIVADPAGGFAINAGHTYAETGTFTTTTTIADAGGSTATATGTVAVGNPAPPAAPPVPPAAPPPPPASPPAAPSPPPASPAPPSPPAPAPPVSDGGRPPKVGVSVPRLAGTTGFALRLTCPAATPGCRGVARVIALPERTPRPPLRGGASVGSALFVLRPGESRNVTIRVAARLRRTLRRARSARLGGVAIAFGAAGHTAASMGPSAMITTARLL
jgi:hypothetical protein